MRPSYLQRAMELYKDTKEYVSSIPKYARRAGKAALVALPLYFAASSSSELRIANKTADDSTAVAYGKAYLLDADSTVVDSLVLDQNGQGAFMMPAVSVDNQYAKFRLYPNYPNPFSGSTRIDFETERPMPVKLEIYSVDGRLVRDFDLYAGSGRNSIDWNGESRTGRRVSPGMYFARLKTPEASRTVKLVMLDYAGRHSNSETARTRAEISGAQKSNQTANSQWRINFGNADTTQPRIEPWTTGTFEVNGSADTTFYSQRENIRVAGKVFDALTMAGVPSAKVKINYLSNSAVDSTLTDTGGDYSLAFSPSAADTHRFVINAAKPGWYSYRDTSLTTTNSLADTLFTFEEYIDPDNAASTDSRKDLLEWLKFMHFRYPDPDSSRIHRWRDEDQPLNVYIETTGTPPPSPTTLSLTRSGLDHVEYQLNKDIFREVPTPPSVGIEIRYGTSSNGFITNWVYDSTGTPMYPSKGRVVLPIDNSGNPKFSMNDVIHELGHNIFASASHSPFCSHIMKSDCSAPEFSPFEVRTLEILYNRPNTYKKKYLIYKE